MYGTTPKCSLKMISKLFQSFQHMKILTTEGKRKTLSFHTDRRAHTNALFLNQLTSCQDTPHGLRILYKVNIIIIHLHNKFHPN